MDYDAAYYVEKDSQGRYIIEHEGRELDIDESMFNEDGFAELKMFNCCVIIKGSKAEAEINTDPASEMVLEDNQTALFDEEESETNNLPSEKDVSEILEPTTEVEEEE